MILRAKDLHKFGIKNYVQCQRMFTKMRKDKGRKYVTYIHVAEYFKISETHALKLLNS